MLQRLAVWLSAVPHYVLALALLVSLYGPEVAQALIATPFSAYVPYVGHAVALAVGILALAKQFNPGTKAAVQSDAAIKQKAPGSVTPLPPITLAMLVGALSGLLVASGVACSSNKLTAQDATDVAEYTAQQSACVAALTPNKAAIDACRAKVKLTWATKWNAEFDGGFGDTSTGGQ